MSVSKGTPDRADGDRLFDRHVSLGSLISTVVSVLAAFGAAAGVWAATQSSITAQGKDIEHVINRMAKLEASRDADRMEINQSLREINVRLSEIQVSLATKQDIRDRQRAHDAAMLPPETDRKRP